MNFKTRVRKRKTRTTIRLLRKILRLFRKPRCYRCGGLAKRQYMGLDYCNICHSVVVNMANLIPQGGPAGFPGSSPGDPEYFER
jgi:hypothetical protein